MSCVLVSVRVSGCDSDIARASVSVRVRVRVRVNVSVSVSGIVSMIVRYIY